MRLRHFTELLSCLLITTAFANPLAQNRDEIEDIFMPFNGPRFDAFDWQLCKALESPDLGNVIVSPVSVKLLLAMVKEGSAGTTEKELETVLEISDEKKLRERYTAVLDSLQERSRDYVLDLGTKMYLDSSVEVQQKYAARLSSFYKTEIGSLNFDNTEEARDEINSWVQNVTHDKIMHMVSSDDLRDALLLLVNALYFKGEWQNQFSKNQTTMGGFYVSPKQTVTVQYMMNYGRYYYTEPTDLDAKILRIPFKGRHFSMYIILPNSKAGLRRLIKDISPSSLKIQLRMMEQSNIHVILPKFKYDFTSKLGKILQKLGLKQMFQTTASLPKISRGKGNRRSLMVTDVIQKAGIEINEEGSTAYAATDFVLANKFGNPDNIFNASNPFLFFIEDEITGTILFVGKVENPVQLEQLQIPNEYSTIDRYGVSGSQSTPSPAAPVAAVPAQQPAVLSTDAEFNLDPQLEESENYEQKRFNFIDVEFLQAVCSQTKDKNVLVSPTSIKITLTMLLEGAAGTTAEELKTALRLPNDSDRLRRHLFEIIDKLNMKTNAVTFEMGNRIYINDRLTPNKHYTHTLQNYYNADVQTLNFMNPTIAANKINEWVNQLTRGYIPSLVTPGALSSDTSAIVMNALFFKGSWVEAFDERQTKPVCFYLANGDCKKTNMMEMSSVFNYAAVDDLDAQAVSLDYQDNTYTMLILVPNKKNGINQLLRDISYVPVHKIVERLTKTDVILSLPRFQIEYTADLVPHLQSLHISELFTTNANLSGIIEGHFGVHVNNIVHKTKIQVNEKGTVAAAGSSAIVVPLMGSTKPRVKADHPFLFFVRHVETGTILFAGRLNIPEDAAAEETLRSSDLYPSTSYQRPVYSSFVNRKTTQYQMRH